MSVDTAAVPAGRDKAFLATKLPFAPKVSLRVPQSESSNPNYTGDSCDPTKTAIN